MHLCLVIFIMDNVYGIVTAPVWLFITLSLPSTSLYVYEPALMAETLAIIELLPSGNEPENIVATTEQPPLYSFSL